MRGYLNRLLEHWPPGFVATPAWLTTMGISRGLTKKYLDSGWIVSLGHGAYARKGDTPGWAGALAAIQKQDKTIWVGGVCALSLHGFIHYLPLGKESLTLYGQSGSRLPKWFRDYDWRVRLLWQTTEMLSVQEETPLPSRPGLVQKQVEGFTLWMSSPERAVLEMLQGVPRVWSFDFAAEILQGASSLSPRKLQSLLELCSNIQVKRLFLFLAQYHQHKWMTRLDVSRIDLGMGKRQIVAGGALNRTWNITVPTHYQR